MQRHGFTAREAAGWLRVVRPGSLTDPRLLDYLVGWEPVLRRMSSAGGDLAARPLCGSGAALAAGLRGSFGPRSPVLAVAGSSSSASARQRPSSSYEFPGDASEVDRLVAQAVAEVDDRLLALKTADNPLRGSASRAHPAPALPSSPAAAAAERAAALSAGRARRYMRGAGVAGASMWRSCPSL